ncbi:hypothetical protein VNO77_33666 [Canavalia gladiata]|uniref:Uncharacterized protein n=1 Tax=Canavalia gladiata TaxID=3824 RepID=A0AAN9KDS1_CANGL
MEIILIISTALFGDELVHLHEGFTSCVTFQALWYCLCHSFGVEIVFTMEGTWILFHLLTIFGSYVDNMNQGHVEHTKIQRKLTHSVFLYVDNVNCNYVGHEYAEQ